MATSEVERERVARAATRAGVGHDRRFDTGTYEVAENGPRLTRRELFFIVAFWMLFALVTVVNRMFDPRSMQPQGSVTSPGNLLAISESLLWAVLTPAVFWLTARFPLDRGDRVAHVTAYVIGGLAVLLIVSVAGDQLREAILPPRPSRRASSAAAVVEPARPLLAAERPGAVHGGAGRRPCPRLFLSEPSA